MPTDAGRQADKRVRSLVVLVVDHVMSRGGAERLIKEELEKMKLDKKELKRLPKGSPKKVRIVRMLRTQTPMTRAWISARLFMGSPSYLAFYHLCSDNRELSNKPKQSPLTSPQSGTLMNKGGYAMG